METILAALITGAVTLIGVLIANSRSQAVTDTKLEELTREVRAHNNFAQRVPVLEEQMKVANHRIADLEANEHEEKGFDTMNAHIITTRTVSAATIARTAVLALALINQILSAAGKPVLPIESAQLEQLISTGFTTVSALVNWWFNNSFTKEAIQADAEFERLRKSVK